MSTTPIPPIRTGLPLVDKNGGGTPVFMRWLNDLIRNTLNTVVKAQDAQAAADNANAKADTAQATADGSVPQTRQVIAGTGLTGGGALSADVTLNADAQAILDEISATQGTILYRGASGWAALAPGAAGTKLTSNGAGADPTWV